jgi:uncharacterized protein
VPITIPDLRRFTVARSLFPPTTLERAIEKLGYVQADPIRAPARAQDLTLRHRVKGYRAGDLERHYVALGIEEDFFLNYGFVSQSLHALMHPRSKSRVDAKTRGSLARRLLAFVREHGAVHPREVDDHFAHGAVVNYWGGSSSATTHLLEAMHYTGLLRVARRDRGIRVYALRLARPEPVALRPAQGDPEPAEQVEGRGPFWQARARPEQASDHASRRVDALVDVVAHIYAPLPASSLSTFIRRLRYAVPQWQSELTAAILRARQRLAHARVDGVDWYWPAGENPSRAAAPDMVRLLAPFDPLVHDRARFELLWGWVYRFEAYTPAAQRKRGYYALPLLWRDRVIGWGNLSAKDGQLVADIGYVDGRPPRDRPFKRELEAELERMRTFLGV